MNYRWFNKCYIFGFNFGCSRNCEAEKWYACLVKKLIILKEGCWFWVENFLINRFYRQCLESILIGCNYLGWSYCLSVNRKRYKYNLVGIAVKILFVVIVRSFSVMFLWNYLKGIKFRGYLISRLEKNYILRVFNFAISVKIRNKSFIEYQFFYC